MGNRLSKLYTKTGDSGTTGLGDGSRTEKVSPRLCAIGEVDELNCTLGLLIAANIPEAMQAVLIDVQHDLFDLGGELSIPGSSFVKSEAVKKVEEMIDAYNADLPPLKEFVLPGGCAAAAAAHFSRAVCRRAERAILALHASEAVNIESIKYINRLSDLLFVVARTTARLDDVGEILWRRT
jgi:cob(I)alamin adenosyltransferase